MRIRRSAALFIALATILALLACSTSTQEPKPSPSRAAVDYAALETAIETSITSGPAALDNVRAVLVVVDGKTEIAHYRHGFTADDHEHIWSVTKSVVSTLIGIAVADGLIDDLDQPLSELLPEHRKDMSPLVAKVTLRDLMTMTGGFASEYPDDVSDRIVNGRTDLVSWSLSKGQERAAGLHFRYSNISADLAAAVLLGALQRNRASGGQTVLDYARTKLFDPLGIQARPVYEGIPLSLDSEFSRAGFAWSRIDDLHLGAFGLRLTAEDMAKLGQLYLDDGVWRGNRLLPEGWVKAATTPGELNRDYGLFWWLDNDPWQDPDTPTTALYMARGSDGQRIVVAPQLRSVVVILSTTTENHLDDASVQALYGSVISALG